MIAVGTPCGALSCRVRHAQNFHAMRLAAGIHPGNDLPRPQTQERRAERHARQEWRENRAFHQGYRAGVHEQPRYVYQQPRHVAPQRGDRFGYPAYRTHAPRFQRGGYLPGQYRQHGYYVNDWRAHSGLYAPPHGHQWMNVNGEFLLVALATGLIASAILNSD